MVKCADSNLIQFNKRKGKVLDLRRNNVRHVGLMLGIIHLGNSFAEKAMGGSKLNTEPVTCP